MNLKQTLEPIGCNSVKSATTPSSTAAAFLLLLLKKISGTGVPTKKEKTKEKKQEICLFRNRMCSSDYKPYKLNKALYVTFYLLLNKDWDSMRCSTRWQLMTSLCESASIQHHFVIYSTSSCGHLFSIQHHRVEGEGIRTTQGAQIFVCRKVVGGGSEQHKGL